MINRARRGSGASVNKVLSAKCTAWNASSRTHKATHSIFHARFTTCSISYLKLATAECPFCFEDPFSRAIPYLCHSLEIRGGVTSKFSIKRTNWNWRKVSVSFELIQISFIKFKVCEHCFGGFSFVLFQWLSDCTNNKVD